MPSYVFSRIEENENPNWRGGIGAIRPVYKFKILHTNELSVEELREEIKKKIDEDGDNYKTGWWQVTLIDKGIRDSVKIEVD